MWPKTSNHSIVGLLLIAAGMSFLLPSPLGAQIISSDAQRDALNDVRAEANSLQNATQTAPSYPHGVAILQQQYEELRIAFANFETTLTPAQWNHNAVTGGLIGHSMDEQAQARRA